MDNRLDLSRADTMGERGLVTKKIHHSPPSMAPFLYGIFVNAFLDGFIWGMCVNGPLKPTHT